MSQPPGYGPQGINPHTGLPYGPGGGDDSTRAYPQSPYGQASGSAPGGYGTGQPAGASAPYGNEQYGNPQYGQDAYGQDAYAAPQAYGAEAAGYAPQGGPFGTATTSESQKTFIATWLLGWLLGSFGADRFYLGKFGTAIAKLLTAGGLGIWTLIDVIRTLFGATRDTEGRPLAGYEQNKKMARLVTFIVWGLGVILGIIMTIVMVATGIFAAASGGGSTGGSSSSSAPQGPSAEGDSNSGADGGAAAEWAEANFGTFETVEQSGSGSGQVDFPADVRGAVIVFDYEPSEDYDYGMLESVGEDNQSSSDVYLSTDFGTPSTSSTAWIASEYSDPVAALNVDGEGDWTVTITPVSTLETLPESGSGSGSYLYDGSGGTHAISTDGEMGMFVAEYSQTDYAEVFPTLVVSESSTAWSGTGDLEPGPGLVTVTTDGDWEITPQ